MDAERDERGLRIVVVFSVRRAVHEQQETHHE